MKTKNVHYPYILTDVIIALSYSLFLLYPGWEGYQSIQQAKFELFCLLFGGYLVLMTLFAIEMALVHRVKLCSPGTLWKRANFVQRAVVVYWCCTVLSTLASPYRVQALVGMSRCEGLLTITLYCGCFLCISEFARPKVWMVYLFGMVMCIFCVICFVQMAGYNPFGLYPNGYNYFDANVEYAGIYLGTMGNADLVAALLCLAIPVFWSLVLRLRESRRWLLAVPLLLCLVILIRMDVQAGLLSILVGTTLMLPVVLPVGKRGRIALWLLVAAGVALCLALVWNSPRSWGTIYELREVLHGNWEDSFGSGRVYIWKQVLSRVPQHLWLGVGPDTMAAAQIPGFTYHDPELGTSVPFIVDVAHNEYLNVLYHQGLPALLAYLAALVGSAVRWLRRSGQNAAAAALGGAVLCYCIQAFL